MKIAHVAPLYESVPPGCYGGTERVVCYLVDALVDLGHDVTLFASGDSRTKAKLVSCREKAIWQVDDPHQSATAAHMSMLHDIRERAHEFDILHFHIDLLPCPFFEELAHRTLSTTHGRLDIKDLKGFYQRWSDFPLVSISDSQRQPLACANWAGTVYHGLPVNIFRPPAQPRANYLAFLGRLSPEKRPHLAIDLAEHAGKSIKVAAKLDTANRHYLEQELTVRLKKPHVDFLGEIGDFEKADVLGHAEALLFPIDWPEPFGMVMIEALACGTPVIAWNCGSVPEIVEHGVTGFIVNTNAEAAEAIGRVHELDRYRVRMEFERRFSSVRMAQGYIELYEQRLNSTPAGSRNASKTEAEFPLGNPTHFSERETDGGHRRGI